MSLREYAEKHKDEIKQWEMEGKKKMGTDLVTMELDKYTELVERMVKAEVLLAQESKLRQKDNEEANTKYWCLMAEKRDLEELLNSLTAEKKAAEEGTAAE
jgi:hypothetical protein